MMPRFSRRPRRKVRPGFARMYLLTGVLLVAEAIAAPPGALAAKVPDASPEARAAAILRAAGVRGGLVVHLGCGAEPDLTAALRAGDAFVVQGLDANAAAVQKTRAAVRAKGLYGPVSVSRWTGDGLPYASNLVNLVVAENPGGAGLAEVMRVLAPGGVAMVRDGKAWARHVKPRPDDIDDWTHYLHGPDGNATARDRRVGPPQHLQWMAGPLWCRSHNGVPSSVALVLSARGRLFSVIDEGLTGQPGLPERWMLVARDAFNGTLLWKRPLPSRGNQRSIVTDGDRLYIASGHHKPLEVLDAATGQTVRTCDGTEGADAVVCIEGTVVAHVGGVRKGGQDDTILAVDGVSGRTRWRFPTRPMAAGTLAAADGRVVFQNQKELVCLALADGQPQWRTPCNAPARGAGLMVYRGAVLVTAGGLRAFALDSGKPLWKGPRVNNRLSLFGAQGLVWISRIEEHGRSFLWTPADVVADGYNPRTGQVERTVTASHLASPGHHIRCYQAKATERYLLLPKRGVEFLDLEGTNHMRHNWLRGPCGHGVVPANGLLYSPPHQCFCYPGVKLTGFNAVAASDEAGAATFEPVPDEARLERGPAYGKPLRNPQSAIRNSLDWPTYRHDAFRSGRAGGDVPAHLQPLWEQAVGGTLTQPVIAEGRLLVADADTHTVHCLDATTGKPLWRFTAEGRIDSPPTLYEGLALFGSADGHVYAVRASDGVLAWRFLAAPAERRIAVRGQPESAWPVHGSVLVQNGAVYCTAGRSSYLDGGIRLWALEPATGRILHRAHLESERPDVTRDAGHPFDMEGARTDLLVTDGTDLYMFFHRFGPDLTEREAPQITKLGDRQTGLHLMSNAGLLDTSWFDRNYWTYSRRWPGYYFGYRAPKTGNILSFDDTRTYGVHVFTERQGHSPRFWPGQDGYELFADTNDAEPVLRPTAIGREKGAGFSRTLLPVWSVKVPVRVFGLVLAGDRLVLAGTPDVVPKDDPYAGIEGRLGGRLWVVSTADGSRLTERMLDRPPVFDGMSAAGGRLYLALDDGRVVCLGAKK